jgi:hypothetical protein
LWIAPQPHLLHPYYYFYLVYLFTTRQRYDLANGEE